MHSDATTVMSDKEGVQGLVFAAHHYGVEHVVICPGSRNAPFTISFNRSGMFTCHSIADERVAGFYALGLALASGKPVVVVCTSGSAGINLGPALAEAYYLRVPLIAITADRPLAWTDQGNGQTIRQEGLFANCIRGAYTVIERPANRDEYWWNRRKISELFNVALTTNPGPVHFNVPLTEPLYHTAHCIPQANRWYTAVHLSAKMDADLLRFFRKGLQVQKVMLLVGQMPELPGLAPLVQKLAAMPNVVVLSETTSNLHAAGVISTIDRIITSISDDSKLASLMPDVLISFGGMVVSKKIKSLLRSHPPVQHWRVHPNDQGLDTYQSLTHEVAMSPLDFLEQLLPMKVSQSDYRAQWQNLNSLAQEAHTDYLQHVPWSDFKAFDCLMPHVQGARVLHMANSSPVRYVQLFGNTQGMTYHANRGTSGIDGSTSTAAGWAKYSPDSSHLLITGDMAFLYDSNALWNAGFPQNLKIVVINNKGGGIFRIIEGPDSTEELETFFEAHHPADISHIAAAYNVAHFEASDEASMREVLPVFMQSKGSGILEVHTPPTKNASVLKSYFTHIAAHFAASGAVASPRLDMASIAKGDE